MVVTVFRLNLSGISLVSLLSSDEPPGPSSVWARKAAALILAAVRRRKLSKMMGVKEQGNKKAYAKRKKKASKSGRAQRDKSLSKMNDPMSFSIRYKIVRRRPKPKTHL